MNQCFVFFDKLM
ncbi:hypothetical protein OIU77_025376 [Salix suchowensis]|uniref:Uncharacterized protein n=1 Tax=Salix suchowensis TaxID=1278906 RepID=A0ABQ9BZ91_9ROSI|nr:hypothetical protein OIU78_012095 [Salix suchowensis]KAJ6391383.1 hypothetical protein OIU77_025376 [Salix suchowensis]